jgi:hypothetical protein
MKFTIIAIAGDNGAAYAVGQFASREAAERRADDWQEQDNPSRDPDGMSYAVSRIGRVADWNDR